MAMEDIHAIVYPNGEISQSAEGVMFSCEEPVWVMIPSQVSLLDLKNVILVNLGEAGRKENLTMMFSYHCGISSVFAVELCVQLQTSAGVLRPRTTSILAEGLISTMLSASRRIAEQAFRVPALAPMLTGPHKNLRPRFLYSRTMPELWLSILQTWMTIMQGLTAMALMMTSSFQRHNRLMLSRLWAFQRPLGVPPKKQPIIRQ
ncbi:hypothetical protein PIB30_078566 [Stylosanthes scabra]|uniref:Uncharacterized protein n=1 Tax=Stylosanthes scabra TaxID=79078 RepID=A0ABU6QQF2_9FABA|nr:hypothetical protein [Stylosanthes scabra]